MDEASASFRGGFARSALCSAERLDDSILQLSRDFLAFSAWLGKGNRGVRTLSRHSKSRTRLPLKPNRGRHRLSRLSAFRHRVRLRWTSDIGPHWCPKEFVDWPGYGEVWTRNHTMALQGRSLAASVPSSRFQQRPSLENRFNTGNLRSIRFILIWTNTFGSTHPINAVQGMPESTLR